MPLGLEHRCQRLRRLLGSCRCCCCAGLSVEEGGPWGPRESRGIRQDSDQVPRMVSVQSPFQQEQLEPESRLGLALWKGPAKGQGFLLRLLKASRPTRSDPRSLKVPHGLGAWLPLSPLLPMPHVTPLPSGTASAFTRPQLRTGLRSSLGVCPSPAYPVCSDLPVVRGLSVFSLSHPCPREGDGGAGSQRNRLRPGSTIRSPPSPRVPWHTGCLLRVPGPP